MILDECLEFIFIANADKRYPKVSLVPSLLYKITKLTYLDNVCTYIVEL